VTTSPAAAAETAYDALAVAYDALTADYPYERWLPALEALAARHGLCGRSLLDIACGTGKSFAPLLARGYDVTGCDLSAAMLDQAQAKAPSARLAHADMRALPDLGRHDLVTCLDDSLNYLLSEADLEAALEGICRSLAAEGVSLWDLNTVAMYRQSFTGAWLADTPGHFVAWQGTTSPDIGSGDRASATIDVFSRAEGGGWDRASSRHVQRHWPAETVVRLSRAVGLEVVAVHGQRRGAVIDGPPDEFVHVKTVYAARRADRHTERR